MTECRLNRCDTKLCEAMCCYDGAYFMNDEEEAAIRLVVKSFPRSFPHLPETYVVDGYWEGEFYGRKTATRPHTYLNPQYPSHFNQSRCVFAAANGYCGLETVAREQGLHPWAYKPSTCWIHPAEDAGDELLPPPLPEDDGFNLGPHYPGYSSVTSCGRFDANGEPWNEALASEIAYYETVKDLPNYGKTPEQIQTIIDSVKLACKG
ncbi:MAG: hypothetical protein EOP07_09225 [Proteobacteria bacterium]|nr:MAG: hypothetical protein EOP07_09225 [Pseudomonadota bacterium]